MKKKNICIKVLVFIIACVVVSCIISACNKKEKIEKYEEKVLEATEKAITALDNYRNNNYFNELQTVFKELEVFNKYLREIEDISEKEIGCWDISMAVGQLKSYDSDDEIKALDYLALGLEHMKDNIYGVGEGYFISFINMNTIDEEHE